MRLGGRATATLILSAIALIGLANASAAAPAPPEPRGVAYSCFPSCDPDDGRFLQVAGKNLATLAGEKVIAYVGVPAGSSSFILGVFDGNVGGLWDIVQTSSDTLLFSVFADPLRDGTGAAMTAQFASDTLAEDAWSDFTYPVDASARAPSGHYFYRVEAGWKVAGTADALDAFKLRTDGQVSLAVQKLGFVAGPNNLNADPAIGAGDPNPDPASNDAGANSYDGKWTFYSWIEGAGTSLVFWDGDADRGDDTDDADTPNTDPDGSGPAQVEGKRPGSPADDTSPFAKARVPGSIAYSVAGAGGALWTNDDPSGGEEWERFEISSASGFADGFYAMSWTGMDAHNAVFVLPPGDLFSEPEPPLPVKNQPPVANAGPDMTGDRVSPLTFDGSASSDPDGSIVAFDWDFGDGTTGSGAVAQHAYAALGTYTATLTVRDNKGATASDAAQVMIANLAPVADAGPDVSAEKNIAVVFDGSRSADADGSIVGYGWDFGDGTGLSGMQVSHAYSGAGTFQVVLTVSDSDGAVASDSMVVSVANRAPVADAGPDRSAVRGVALSFDGSGSFDDGTIVSYSWDFGDGGSATGMQTSHAWGQLGQFTVTLTVIDEDGAGASDSAVVNVANAPPVADAGSDRTTFVFHEVNFDGGLSYDPDGTITSFSWDFGDGQNGFGVQTTHRYGSPGTFVARLTVIDNSGSAASDSLIVTVRSTTAPGASGDGAVPETQVTEPSLDMTGPIVAGPLIALIAGLGGAGMVAVRPIGRLVR